MSEPKEHRLWVAMQDDSVVMKLRTADGVDVTTMMNPATARYVARSLSFYASEVEARAEAAKSEEGEGSDWLLEAIEIARKTAEENPEAFAAFKADHERAVRKMLGAGSVYDTDGYCDNPGRGF